jgi:hypothetical protein
VHSDQQAVQELMAAIFAAARAASGPVHAQIVATDQREKEVMWIGLAYEALSFHLVLATRMAQMRSDAAAPLLVNTLGELIVPRLAATFFSDSPPDAQEKATRAFQEGHTQAESDYGAYQALFPRGQDHDPDCLVSRFADRLLTVLDRDLDQQTHDAIFSEVRGAVESSMKDLEFPRLVQEACDALVSPAVPSPGAAPEPTCPCGSGAPFTTCHGDGVQA